jgi:FAD:protein FMN transferase
MKAIKKFFSLGLIFLFISCKTEPHKRAFVITGEAQGSTYAIKYISEREIVNKNQIDSLLKAFDETLSTYLPTSEISRLNFGDTTVTLDVHFQKTFALSKRIYENTNGLFNPAIGVLVNAYGFGPVKTMSSPPTATQIDSLKAFMNFDALRIENTVIQGFKPGMYLDFNAIAQGYSVDVLADFLKSKGIEHAIIELGGEIVGLGTNILDEKPWVVGIDDPTQSPDERTLIAKIALTNKGLATSGNYRKIKTDETTGAQFVHILNPITGASEKTSILSVTVIAATCGEADGYATALMLMTLEEIKSWSEKNKNIELLVIYADKNQTQIWETDQLKNLKQ